MSKGKLLVNKRKLPRWKCSIDVQFRIINENKSGIFKNMFFKHKEGQSREFNAGGALLVTKEKLTAGMRLAFNIYLPATESTVKALCDVAWVTEKIRAGEKKYFIGVKYVDIITESDEILEEILEKKLKAGAKTNLVREDALRQARYEYFMCLLNEEPFKIEAELEKNI